MSDIEAMREDLLALQRRYDGARRDLADYSEIFKVTQSVLTASGNDEIEQAMFEGIRAASDADAIAIFEPCADEIVCSRASDSSLTGTTLPNGKLARDIIGGRAVAIPNIARHTELSTLARLSNERTYVCAAMFPFQGPGGAGLVMLLSSEIGFFQVADANRLRAFGMIASQGMAALLRVRLATERATAEADRMAAVAADEAKSMFLASTSHEIRTPLNGVLGMAQLLQAEDLKPAQHEMVETILGSGRSLLSLLNDVLDLSKIQAGKMEVTAAPSDIRALLQRAERLFGPQAASRSIALDIEVDADVPQVLSFDPARVSQCINNLLSNAVKFTEQGRIHLRTRMLAADDGAETVRIDVTDSGIGIPSDVQARLFNAFTQADGSITRKFGGTGLGLAISKRLANLMGGDISVVSEKGAGSTFSFTFKATDVAPKGRQDDDAAKSESSAPSQGAEFAGVRILLTDDHPINRRVVRLMLMPERCEITEASNGEEVLDLLDKQSFDIVLLDIHMPVMDGVETIRRIRTSSQPWRDIPVIALTADAMSGDRERYIALGMTDYVSKPVDKTSLLSSMTKILSPGTERKIAI